MSKYPYFAKKGRPSKEEADLCKEINKMVNSGQVKESDIDELAKTDGLPTNLEELRNFIRISQVMRLSVPKKSYIQVKLKKMILKIYMKVMMNMKKRNMSNIQSKNLATQVVKIKMRLDLTHLVSL